MTLYVDASAFLKRYLQEARSDEAQELMLEDPHWITARHTAVEVRRALARDLKGTELQKTRARFSRDWGRTTIIELTEEVCETAAQIAEARAIRTLDALHLGAAQDVGSGTASFLTYDRRQAQTARTLGWTVLGL